MAAIGCATQTYPLPRLPTQHIIAHGDTLGMIARKYYGPENVGFGIQAILDANPATLEMERKTLRVSYPPLTIPELKPK